LAEQRNAKESSCIFHQHLVCFRDKLTRAVWKGSDACLSFQTADLVKDFLALQFVFSQEKKSDGYAMHHYCTVYSLMLSPTHEYISRAYLPWF
jgi:hypothetical protein